MKRPSIDSALLKAVRDFVEATEQVRKERSELRQADLMLAMEVNYQQMRKYLDIYDGRKNGSIEE